MPESDAASLFALTVRIPLFTDSPVVSEVSAATPSSVSYTHLDVYKRQSEYETPMGIQLLQ